MIGVYANQSAAMGRAMRYVCRSYKRHPNKRLLVAEIYVYGQHMYAVGPEENVSRKVGYCLVRKIAYVKRK